MNKRQACKISELSYPTHDIITSRQSTLRRSMASTIAHIIPCTPEKEEMCKGIFCDDEEELKCAYCGEKATHLDHLFPLIDGKFPTGYGTEPGNLVPCCSRCNQSKGNKKWNDYIDGLSIDEETKNASKKKIDNLLKSNLKPNKIEWDEIDGFREEWDELCNKIDEVLNQAKSTLEKYKKIAADKYRLDTL